MPPKPLRVAIVAEDRGLSSVARSFAETAVRASGHEPSTVVQWEVDPQDRECGYFRWSSPSAKRAANFGRFDPRIHGKFSGLPDESAARRRLIEVWTDAKEPAAIILARDDDRVEGRWEGLDAARQAFGQCAVLLAVPVPESEAWLLVAYDHPSGTKAINQLAAQLSFHPQRQPERMNSTSGPTSRDAKTVWQSVLEADPDAEEHALEASIERLRTAPAASRLPVYVEEVETRLCPLLTAHAGSREGD